MATEEGKLYWLRVKNSRHPSLYLGETKASRYKYTLHVQKPSCCLVYKGGPKLDVMVDEQNLKNEASYAEKMAEFEKKWPAGTIPGDLSPSLILYEPVEVVSYMQKGKKAYKVKKS